MKMRKPNQRRLWMIGGIVAACVLLVIGYAAFRPGSWFQYKRVVAVGCHGTKANDFGCLKTYYDALTRVSAPAEAFKQLRAAYPKSAIIQSQCHQLTHVIGRAALDRYKTIGKTYSYGDSFCWSGYYHGVMERVAAVRGYADIAAHADEICADLRRARAYSFDHYNCAHGLGHGFMAVQGDELFKSL